MLKRSHTCTPIVAVVMLLVLPGCVSTGYVAEYATGYNKAVEETNNEELLLNVLRAMKRRPMYFSYVSTVRGGSGWTFGPSTLTIPFGAGSGSTAHSIAAAAGYAGTSGFDVGIVDTQEFMRGFTTPVSVKTLDYYWSQDWPRELLWFLFVKKIEIVHGSKVDEAPDRVLMNVASATALPPQCDKDKPETCCTKDTVPHCVVRGSKLVTSFNNYPDDPDEFDRFRVASRRLLEPSFDLEPIKSKDVENVGPELDAYDAIDVEKSLLRKGDDAYSLKALKKDGSTSARYQLQHVSSDYSLEYFGGCEAAAAKKAESEKKKGGQNKQTESENKNGKPGEEQGRTKAQTPTQAESAGTSNAANPCDDAPHLSIYLRSPEAILYYLGEVARAGIRADKSAMPAKGRAPNPVQASMCSTWKGDPLADQSPILEIHELDSTEVPTPLVVTFDGKLYGIPPQRETQESIAQCRQETTMQTLSLVSEIINLQKSIKDLPASNVVHVAP